MARADRRLPHRPPLTRCAAFTEPGWFVDGEALCPAVERPAWDEVRGRRVHADGAIEPLRATGGDPLKGFDPVGRLIGRRETRDLLGGAPKATAAQPDPTRSREGSVLSPSALADEDRAPLHRGRRVAEIADLARGRIARGADGRTQIRTRIAAAMDAERFLGPGPCVNEPAARTGALITRLRIDRGRDPLDLRVSTRATGLHP